MKKSSAILLALVVGIICTALTYSLMTWQHNAEMAGGDDRLSLREFQNVENVIDKYYLRDYDMKNVEYAGLKAMVASLGDPYSVYYTPEEYAAFTRNSTGEYNGVGMGISIDETTGLTVVSYFMEGSSAQAAGLEVGDYIVSIDGQDVTGKTLQEISVLCIGDEGTSIKIGVKRGDKVLEFTMKREPISLDMVEYSINKDNIGYMRIKQFGGNCEALFNEGMDEFEKQNVKGIIFDLRDNPGGYLNTVVAMLNRLLPEGTIVYTEDKYGNRDTETSDAAFVDIPMVLLVNGNTASASEIFAGAIQDYGMGQVVGTRTYGKGVVQVVLPISSTGGGIKITASQYFTPKGRSIDGNGIYPDYYVEKSGDGDVQMDKAQSVLRAIINNAKALSNN
jgi:carboxyl-terminal processing protease